MAAIEADARTRGCATIQLDYMSLAPWLKAYYERYGFQETGETVQWGAIALVQMAKPLN